nr:MAG TPA: hypothetical protein [Inoviridae sp.]
METLPAASTRYDNGKALGLATRRCTLQVAGLASLDCLYTTPFLL